MDQGRRKNYQPNIEEHPEEAGDEYEAEYNVVEYENLRRDMNSLWLDGQSVCGEELQKF